MPQVQAQAHSQQGVFAVASLMLLIRACTRSFFMPGGGSPKCRGGGVDAYVRLSKRQSPCLPDHIGSNACELSAGDWFAIHNWSIIEA